MAYPVSTRGEDADAMADADAESADAVSWMNPRESSVAINKVSISVYCVVRSSGCVVSPSVLGLSAEVDVHIPSKERAIHMHNSQLAVAADTARFGCCFTKTERGIVKCKSSSDCPGVQVA
jgi:hypothetical protein